MAFNSGFKGLIYMAARLWFPSSTHQPGVSYNDVEQF